jgi:hypothetical protein
VGRSRAKSPPSGWAFWRRAFWSRPALLLCYAIVAGGLGGLALYGVPGAIQDAVAMRGAPVCPTAPDPPPDCLERVKATLSGPWYSRGLGSKWHLLVERNGRQVIYAETTVPTTGSQRLKQLGEDPEVVALLWEGEPVLIEAGAGEPVQTDSWGTRDWLMWFGIGWLALSGALMLLDSARVKRRTASGWWSVDGRPEGLITDMSPLMQVAVLLCAPPMLALPPLAFGLHPALAATVGLLGLALAVFVVVKVRTKRRRTD